MTPSDRAADRLISRMVAVCCCDCICITLEKCNGAASGSYMSAVVPSETVYASHVLVLRVPAFATWHLYCAGSAGRLASRSWARPSTEVFSCDGACLAAGKDVTADLLTSRLLIVIVWLGSLWPHPRKRAVKVLLQPMRNVSA